MSKPIDPPSLTLYIQPVSNFIDLEKLIFSLGSELKARRMEHEVDQLRRLYAVERRRTTGRPACDALTVVEWAAMVAIPPFEGVFIKQTAHHRCPCWGRDRDRGRTQTKVFPASGNAPAITAHWCRACGSSWVVLSG